MQIRRKTTMQERDLNNFTEITPPHRQAPGSLQYIHRTTTPG